MTERQLKLEALKTAINNQASNPLILSFSSPKKLIKELFYDAVNKKYRTKSTIKELAAAGISIEGFCAFLKQFYKTSIKNNNAYPSKAGIKDDSPKKNWHKQKINYANKQDKGRKSLEKFIQYIEEQLVETPTAPTSIEAIDTVDFLYEYREKADKLLLEAINDIDVFERTSKTDIETSPSLKNYYTNSRDEFNEVIPFSKSQIISTLKPIKKEPKPIEEILGFLKESYKPREKREFSKQEIEDELSYFKRLHEPLKKLFNVPVGLFIEIIYNHLNPKNYTIEYFQTMYYKY